MLQSIDVPLQGVDCLKLKLNMFKKIVKTTHHDKTTFDHHANSFIGIYKIPLKKNNVRLNLYNKILFPKHFFNTGWLLRLLKSNILTAPPNKHVLIKTPTSREK